MFLIPLCTELFRCPLGLQKGWWICVLFQGGFSELRVSGGWELPCRLQLSTEQDETKGHIGEHSGEPRVMSNMQECNLTCITVPVHA